MNCRRPKFRLCLCGYLLLRCGLAIGAPGPPAANAAAVAPPDPALESLLRGVEGKYNRLKTLQLHFRQIYRQEQQVLREEGGTLYLRKPGQMRWEYENPEPKLFLTDGRRLTLYVPEENRMTETEAASSSDLRSPLRFLLGGLQFRKEFQQIERLPDAPTVERGDVVIKAVPKQMKDRLDWVLLEVTPQYQIRRMILSEPGGVQTEFRFENEVSNPELSPQLFRLQPPEGTQIIRQ
jgi:outer membrane lipoprotein carrier protein